MALKNCGVTFTPENGFESLQLTSVASRKVCSVVVVSNCLRQQHGARAQAAGRSGPGPRRGVPIFWMSGISTAKSGDGAAHRVANSVIRTSSIREEASIELLQAQKTNDGSYNASTEPFLSQY